jgi:hypothetical protein
MTAQMASGFAYYFDPITYSFLARAYIEKKSAKSDKAGLALPLKYEISAAWSQKKSDRNGIKVPYLADNVAEKPDKSDTPDTAGIVLEKPDKSDSTERGAFDDR